ncbi:methyl-accepting chemotaxis protein [bacterium D16-51]|nr:methyl-accepting chemotaxis protein [bacterium D16-59]RKI61734.1 methyl-accepting chemotaxis protein [bacterium D16-51]
MKEIFTKRLFLYMLTALFVTVAAIFVLQTVISKGDRNSDSQSKLEDVKQKLASNQENIKSLTDNLGKENLAKTRAFADMLAADGSINGNMEKLNQVKDRLMVNELHIIDENGIITSSTIEDYIGFDMKSGEQSNAFMVIVDDPSVEIVQEPQVNVAEGVVMQYIGVARKDAKGLVQVGVRPEVLENMLASTAINVVLKDVDYGKKGYVYAIDQKEGKILAHPEESLIGKSAAEAGFPKKLTGNGKATIHGVKGYYWAEEYDGKVIGTFMPSGEYYEDRTNQTLVVSFSVLIILGILLFMINRMVDNKIVQGINRISNSMKEIASGNYGITVNEQGNPEFEQLSQSINTMVGGISQNLKEIETLLEQQKEDVESNRALIQNVKDACVDLEQVSGETLENADSIYNGTGEQEKAVDDLKQVMDQLTGELSLSVSASADITAATGNSVDKIMETQAQMDLLKESMQRISEMSVAIEKIIGEINSIAKRTNMLSLNASVEAARAGEMGRGFSVVAVQIGELAARSAQAAKETTELITNSIQAVESGQQITDQTAEAFDIAVENIEKANQDVEKITNMVQKNVEIVTDAVSQIERISSVVEQNVQISNNTKQASSSMADITGKLLEMIE